LKALVAGILSVMVGSSVFAQARAAGQYDELIALVGIKLDELISRFGAPASVHAARGVEEWQDDVVFVYPHGDFYVYGDRVWQVGLGAVPGMKVGDPGAVARLLLGADTEDGGSFLVRPLQPLPEMGWPVAMRVNFNAAGAISAIFVYRTDF
jgi:hypothetical protein